MQYKLSLTFIIPVTAIAESLWPYQYNNLNLY